MKRPENIQQLRRLKQIRTFLVFVILTLVFWVFHKLSQTYTDYVAVNVQVNTQKSTSIFHQLMPVQSYVKVKTSGFNLLYLKIFSKKITLNTSDLKPISQNTYYYLPNSNLNNFHQQWNKLIQFEKDTIWIEIAHKNLKKVPIKLNLHVQCKDGFRLMNTLKAQPDSITIGGTVDELKKIRLLETQPLVMKEVNKDFTTAVSLNTKMPWLQNISFQQTYVEIEGKVNRITEKTFEIPITILNETPQSKIQIFPKTAILKVQMTYDQARQWDSTEFEIACKVPTEPSNAVRKLPLDVIQKPNGVLYYNIIPHAVDYFIE